MGWEGSSESQCGLGLRRQSGLARKQLLWERKQELSLVTRVQCMDIGREGSRVELGDCIFCSSESVKAVEQPGVVRNQRSSGQDGEYTCSTTCG